MGWPGLFAAAFERSHNAMLLTDTRRIIVDANPALLALIGRPRKAVIDRPVFDFAAEGPLASDENWQSALAASRFTDEGRLLQADGTATAVQWAANVETVTGRRLVLFVALSTSRWGARFRSDSANGLERRGLTPREKEIVHLVSLGARSRAHLVAKALAEGHVPGGGAR